MPRLNSRIRTVGVAFPAQGPAFLAGTLSGTVPQVRRFGRNPVVRGRQAATLASLQDRPEMVIRSASDRPAATPATTPPGTPGGCEDCG
jgi:hypothetical protein